jgi:selenide,water dikinase
MGPAELAQVLAGLPRAHVSDERLLATWDGGEDAALWKIGDGRLGILTVDFITPVVDDPYAWGQIAAANSISDVFAMGGRPIIALNVVGFPTRKLGLDVLQKVLEGGFSKVQEAGAFLAGGHSVQDEEPKYGLVVYGEARENDAWRTTGARPGDALILTKPVGTGIAATAAKADMAEDPETITEALRWMTALNDVPAKLSEDLRRAVKAATDVTGFGLAGHILDMLGGTGQKDPNLNLQLFFKDVPLLPGVLDLADMGLVPEGSYRNRAAYEERVKITRKYSSAETDVLFDAQTSGGLLLAVSPDFAQATLRACRDAGFVYAAVIGEFTPGDGKGTLEVQ